MADASNLYRIARACSLLVPIGRLPKVRLRRRGMTRQQSSYSMEQRLDTAVIEVLPYSNLHLKRVTRRGRSFQNKLTKEALHLTSIDFEMKCCRIVYPLACLFLSMQTLFLLLVSS